MGARKGTLVVMISAVMVLTLCLAWSVSKAFQPPPHQKYRGPSMVGTLTMTPNPETEEVDFTFTGRCGGLQPDAGLIRDCDVALFAEITREDLQEWLFECPYSLYECWPKNVTAVAIDILNVISYQEEYDNGTRTKVIAQVVMIWVI